MAKQKILKRALHISLLLVVAGLLISASFFLTDHVVNDEGAKLLVQEFGHISILLISFLIGVSMVSPVPAATFTPIFVAGGIHIITVIILAVIGTMLANLVSYAIGRLGHDFTNTNYPKLQEKIYKLYSEKRNWIPYFVFAYATFAPFPDEIYLIPFGVVGVRIREFIIPLLLGTTLFQGAIALGFNNIFQTVLGL